LQKFGNEKPVFSCILAVFFIFAAHPSIASATEIVVNKTVSATDYSTADIRAIFTMKKTVWPNRRLIRVYTLPDNNPIHKEFVKNNLHILAHQLRRVWDRMTYSGTGVAPIELDSEQEMIDKIATTPDSIGYLSSRPDNENIHSFKPE
jgi:ABC-type phosphate transport system substrate-binding protein